MSATASVSFIITGGLNLDAHVHGSREATLRQVDRYCDEAY